MKAEEFIREKIRGKIREKYKWVAYLKISEQNELEELIKTYARIQIEKDRVSESELMVQVNIDSKAYNQSYRTCFLEGAETVLRQLRYRPINLD